MSRMHRVKTIFNTSSFAAVVGLAAIIGAFQALPVRQVAAIERPEQVIDTKVGVFTKLGTQVNLNREFTDSSGKVATLKDFMQPGKPAIIVPVYYRCPRLCGLVLDGVIALLNNLPLSLGKEYSVLAVSFNPVERSDEANETREKFRGRVTGSALEGYDAFKFLVGNAVNVRDLMEELGFKFLPDGEDFAHSAAVMILTPTGEISQYFTGIEFSPWDVRLSLVEASSGGVGTAIDHLLLYCFRFDSLKGKYTWAVVGLLRIGGVLTLLGLAAVYFLFGSRFSRARLGK
jgi:protein SCO1/2